MSDPQSEPQKEPMIDKGNRPSPINFDTPVSELRVQDLMGIIGAHIAEQAKHVPHPEAMKPETFKPETFKPELTKPEVWKGEWRKPELFKEFQKPEHFKEAFKGDSFKEGKPELKPDPLVDQVANRVVDILQQRGLLGRSG